MKPDRAHRTLNTILLVIVLGAVTLDQPSPVEPSWSDYLMQSGFWLAVLGMVYLLIRLGIDHRDEIAAYLEIHRGQA